jgi:sortase A
MHDPNLEKQAAKVSSEYNKILIIRTIGNFLVLSSLFFIGKTFYQPIQEEAKYFFNKKVEKQYVVASNQQQVDTIKKEFNATTEKGGLAKLLNVEKVEVLVPQDVNYSIVIPKIGANANIIQNVNAAVESEYLEALKHGVAHTAGTANPGEGGHMVMFAHSTDYIWNVGTYNAVFYLLYKLEDGDEINLFYKGQRHVYKVTGKKVVDPSEVEYITKKTDKEFLTLQTCYPAGTTLQRLLIFAEKVE